MTFANRESFKLLDFDSFLNTDATVMDHATIYGNDIENYRRHIEKVGQDYLKGTIPLIHSASLRGPFVDSWSNPWKTMTDEDPAGSKDFNIPVYASRHSDSEEVSSRKRKRSSRSKRTLANKKVHFSFPEQGKSVRLQHASTQTDIVTGDRGLKYMLSNVSHRKDYQDNDEIPESSPPSPGDISGRLPIWSKTEVKNTRTNSIRSGKAVNHARIPTSKASRNRPMRDYFNRVDASSAKRVNAKLDKNLSNQRITDIEEFSSTINVLPSKHDATDKERYLSRSWHQDLEIRSSQGELGQQKANRQIETPEAHNVDKEHETAHEMDGREQCAKTLQNSDNAGHVDTTKDDTVKELVENSEEAWEKQLPRFQQTASTCAQDLHGSNAPRQAPVQSWSPSRVVSNRFSPHQELQIELPTQVFDNVDVSLALEKAGAFLGSCLVSSQVSVN